LILADACAGGDSNVGLECTRTVQARGQNMLNAIGFGPLMSPGLGVWDLVAESPEAGITLVAVLFAMAMTGIALAVFGGRQREQRAETVAVVVQAPRPRRRTRRRR
jgi:hypothetical protein